MLALWRVLAFSVLTLPLFEASCCSNLSSSQECLYLPGFIKCWYFSVSLADQNPAIGVFNVRLSP